MKPCVHKAVEDNSSTCTLQLINLLKTPSFGIYMLLDSAADNLDYSPLTFVSSSSRSKQLVSRSWHPTKQMWFMTSNQTDGHGRKLVNAVCAYINCCKLARAVEGELPSCSNCYIHRWGVLICNLWFKRNQNDDLISPVKMMISIMFHTFRVPFVRDVLSEAFKEVFVVVVS